MTRAVREAPSAGGLRTVPEVAEYLRLSRSKVYALMDDGTLPYVKLGKSRRVPWQAVIEMVETHTIARG